jgi:hypothetical protein
MTTTNEQSIARDRLVKAGKFVILFLIALLGLSFILVYFDLSYILIAIFAILALAMSVVLFTKQTYFKIYSLPAFITSLLFSVSCLMTVYGTVYGSQTDIASLYIRTGLRLVGLGFFTLGMGFAIAATSVLMLSMNKFDFWKAEYAIEFKYPKYLLKSLLVLALIAGSYIFVVGLFMVVSSLQNLS